MADDGQKDDHSDYPHHPTLLEEGKHETKFWQMMNEKTITINELRLNDGR
jgi:hypothetical protein